MTAEAALRFLDERRDELIAFAGDLIHAPSPNPPGDERAVVQVVTERLRAFGLRPEVVAKRPERPNLVTSVGETGLTLLFNGHLDTKPPGDIAAWETYPYRPTVENGRMYGLGACDMKGQVAALTYATAALAHAGSLPGRLILALSADEECGSAYGARYLVEEAGLSADAVIVGEASGITEDWELLPVLARGFSGFRVEIHGTQMHSSLSARMQAVNASTAMAHVLLRLARDLEIHYTPHPFCPEGVTINPGVRVSGGVDYGVVPGYAEFSVDVRTLPGMTREGLRRDVDRLLDQLRAEDDSLRVDMEFEEGPLGWAEPSEIAPDSPLVRAAAAACRDIRGRTPALGAFPGGTDGAVFSRAGMPSIPAFGPGRLPLAHRPNEWISTEALPEAAKIYALTAFHYLGDTAPDSP